MEIEIKRDIFYGTDFKSLNYFLQLATYKSRYVIVVDLVRVIDSYLYRRLDEEDKEYLQANFNKQILEQSQNLGSSKVIKAASYYITNRPNGNKEFNIEEGVKFFAQPVSIILENSLNDSYFIKAIIKFFDSNGEVKRHLANGWLEIENAGGCTNVENFINEKLKAYNGLPKEEMDYLRCFVLLDSDRTSSTQPLNYKHINLEKFLVQGGIVYHILEKRSMENYMPDEVMNELRSPIQNEWIDAYLNLTSEQKDFFNISIGFSKKDGNGLPRVSRNHLVNEVQILYANLSDKSYNILNNGFTQKEFKNSFPAKFETSHNVYKNTLLGRTKDQNVPNELQEILQKVDALL